MKININQFLDLKFRYEDKDYFSQGSGCIYQDLIKDNYTVREILYALSKNIEFLNVDKYQDHEKLKYDHMTHYIHCINFGFRKDVISWREEGAEVKLVKPEYYAAKEKMSANEIDQFLQENPIIIDRSNIVKEGMHRTFCMIGRLYRGEKYIDMTCADSRYSRVMNNVWFKGIFDKRIANVGYRQNHNKSRLKSILKNIKQQNFTVIDIGSNYGFFSLSIAKKFPNCHVFSIEGSFGTGNEDVVQTKQKEVIETVGIRTHAQQKEIHRLFNNYILCGLMTVEKIEALHEAGVFFDYQLSLSVFHWIIFEKLGNHGDKEVIYEALYKHLTLARVTFLELPDFEQGTSLASIYAEHKDLPNLINHLNQRYNTQLSVEFLGEHNWYGVRTIYKVTNDNKVQIVNSDKAVLLDVISPTLTL